MNQPLVTIGVPVYNGATYLRETLNSILAQTYQNIEIIIADNSSSDNSVEIANEFVAKDSRVRCVVANKNLGYSGNVNRIISSSSGEYICVYHSDDVYKPEIVEQEVSFLSTYDSCGAVFTLADCIDENGRSIAGDLLIQRVSLEGNSELIIDLEIFLRLMTSVGNILICPSGMVRKSVYDMVGGYDESIRLVEDQDMWLRILSVTKIGLIIKPLMDYRIHSKQGSHEYKDAHRDSLAVPYLHLASFLNKNSQFWYFQERLAVLNAEDYIRMAICHMIRFQLQKAKNLIANANNQLAKSSVGVLPFRSLLILCMMLALLFSAFRKRFYRSNPKRAFQKTHYDFLKAGATSVV